MKITIIVNKNTKSRGSLQKGPKIFTFAVDSNDDVSLLADQHQKAGLCTPVEFAKILKHEKNNS